MRCRVAQRAVSLSHDALSLEGDADTSRDDEYITEDGYLEQPPDTVPLITGFNYISKIFRRKRLVLCA